MVWTLAMEIKEHLNDSWFTRWKYSKLYIFSGEDDKWEHIWGAGEEYIKSQNRLMVVELSKSTKNIVVDLYFACMCQEFNLFFT